MEYEVKESNEIINLISIVSNAIFLFMHIAYLIIFLISKSYILVYINEFGVILYTFLYILIYKKKYTIFAIICGVEIPLYMSLATMISGYNAGFHLCLIGLCVLAFVCKYFFREIKLIVDPLLISVLYAIIYMLLYFYCKYNDPFYELPSVIDSLLFLTHSLVVFVFCVGFMYILIRHVFKLESKIRKEAETDRLTQVANRKALFEFYDKLGDQKSNYILAMFDIDEFKHFNDINGHLCGDYVLSQIAKIAKNNSEDDFVSRFGGEEFIVLSKIDENLDKTYEKIDRIRNNIYEYSFEYGGKKLHSSITMGVALYNNYSSLDEWILEADKKLYEGKNSGKNKIIY